MRQHRPRTVPIASTFVPHPCAVGLALKAGAVAVWSKAYLPAQRCADLDRIVASGFRLPPLRTAERMGLHLTPREVELITRLCRHPEPSVEQVADAMGCTPKTLDAHRCHVYSKLGVHSRQQLHFRAVELGLIDCACKQVRWGGEQG